MPWPSCSASSPSTILHGRSPKTVTRIGFATPWILISVDPLKMRRRRLATLGRLPGACGDEHDPPVCEICLVVGAYRRLPCPPMHQWTGHQPVNRPLVDLTPHLRLLSVSRTALAALSAYVAYAAAPEATRFSVGGPTSPGLLHSTRGLFWSSLPECWPSRRSGSGPRWPCLGLQLCHLCLEPLLALQAFLQ